MLVFQRGFFLFVSLDIIATFILLLVFSEDPLGNRGKQTSPLLKDGVCDRSHKPSKNPKRVFKKNIYPSRWSESTRAKAGDVRKLRAAADVTSARARPKRALKSIFGCSAVGRSSQRGAGEPGPVAGLPAGAAVEGTPVIYRR